MTIRAQRDYDLARLLLLIDAFSDETKDLKGLTKLAKLDFLLRYPVFLEKLAKTLGETWPNDLAPSFSERNAVESTMIRYKYGPWDTHYYSLLGAMIGRGLLRTRSEGGAIHFALTPAGVDAARQLRWSPSWRLVADRTDFLRARFNVSGNRLRELIYQLLPEAVDRPHWAEIT